MKSLSSTSLITPPFHHHIRSTSSFSPKLKPFRSSNRIGYRSKALETRGSAGDEDEDEEVVDKVLRLYGSIQGSSIERLKE
ncbi:hypothetical protein Tco_1269814 [Tanacetum coccineum]